MRRNPAIAVALAVALAGVLAGGVAVVATRGREALAARERAVIEERRRQAMPYVTRATARLERATMILHQPGATLADARSELEAALADADLSVVKDPWYREAHFVRARLHLAMGNANRALASLDDTLRVQPAHVAARFARMQLYAERGSASEDARRIVEADAEVLERAEGLEAEQRTFARGLRALARGEWREADEALTAVLARDPFAIDVYKLRGDARGRSGRFDEASADYAEAARRRGAYFEAHRARARLLAERGAGRHAAEAVAAWGECLRIHPWHLVALLELVRFCREHAPGLEAAALEAVSRAASPRVEALLLLGIHRAEQGELDAALALFDRALAGRARADGRVWRAIVRVRLGRVEEAEKTLAELTSDAGVGALARANLGVLRGEIGEGADPRNRALASLAGGNANVDLARLDGRLRGAAWLMRGDAAEAVAELQDAADAASLNNAGVAMLMLARAGEARKILDRAVAAGGADVVRRAVLANRARVRLEEGDAAGAERDATAAMGAGDESASVRRVRARARERLGRMAEASADEAEARSRGGEVGKEWRGRVVVEGAWIFAAHLVVAGEEGVRLERAGDVRWVERPVVAAHEVWAGR